MATIHNSSKEKGIHSHKNVSLAKALHNKARGDTASPENPEDAPLKMPKVHVGRAASTIV